MELIFVTGASGFLGKALCLSLLQSGYQVRGTYRSQRPTEPELQPVEWVAIDHLLPSPVWDPLLVNCQVVIHAAACVHQMRVQKSTARLFFEDNILGTQALVNAVIRAGTIKQFIFISSLLVYGREQLMPLNKNSFCEPDTLYGESKLTAENLMRRTLSQSQTAWTILRPAVMYNSLANTGNVASLLHWINKKIPLPCKGVKNKRSFLSIENMCYFVKQILGNRACYGEIYAVADRHPVSTETFIRSLAKAHNKSARLIVVPLFLQYTLALVGQLLQKFGFKSPWNLDVFSKVTGNFWVDMDPICAKLPLDQLQDTQNALGLCKATSLTKDSHHEHAHT